MKVLGVNAFWGGFQISTGQGAEPSEACVRGGTLDSRKRNKSGVVPMFVKSVCCCAAILPFWQE